MSRYREKVPRVGKRSAEEIDKALRETERKREEWRAKRRAEFAAKGLRSDGKPLCR